jgi:predicted nucleic acid-binding protein
MIVLDTNVISEMMRAHPAPRVSAWFAANPAPSLFTTALTEAEILYGLSILAAGKRRNALLAAAAAIFAEDLGGRVLAFDSPAAAAYAEIAAARRRSGQPISQTDAQIAAVAKSRGAALATRNTRDFSGCGVALVNPWSAA